LLKHLEVDALPLKPFANGDEMKDAPGEPVELGDHERVAFPPIFKRGLKLRSLGQR